MYKYNTGICLIIRDENEYLQEWIRHHISVGFEHLYIYDHNCSIPVQQTINTCLKRDERDRVTVINWSGTHKHAQGEAYTHCCKNFGSETKWIAFIDMDEFIVLKHGLDINGFLARFDNRKDIGGVYMNWVMFNANGQEKHEYKPVMERFTQTCEDAQQFGKLISRADKTIFEFIHEARYINNMVTVDEDGNTVIGRRHPYHTEYIQCNHYYTKSWEEWKHKINRGVADPTFGRNLREFFLYNPDMAYLDTEADYFQKYERGVSDGRDNENRIRGVPTQDRRTGQQAGQTA